LEYIVSEIFAWPIVRILTLWSSNNKMVDFTRFLTSKLQSGDLSTLVVIKTDPVMMVVYTFVQKSVCQALSGSDIFRSWEAGLQQLTRVSLLMPSFIITVDHYLKKILSMCPLLVVPWRYVVRSSLTVVLTQCWKCI